MVRCGSQLRPLPCCRSHRRAYARVRCAPEAGERNSVSGEPMASVIDFNSDLGESFGSWKLGLDEEVVKYVTSVNVATGFHAGDPDVMASTVKIIA